MTFDFVICSPASSILVSLKKTQQQQHVHLLITGITETAFKGSHLMIDARILLGFFLYRVVIFSFCGLKVTFKFVFICTL